MPKRIAFVEAEIDRRLRAAIPDDSPNVVTSHDVREWARRYLAQVDAEGVVTEPHWDVSLHNLGVELALFVVLIFRREGVELFCGTGDAYAVFHYSDGIQGVDQAYSILLHTFDVPEPPLHVERRAAALWLGRGWRP